MSTTSQDPVRPTDQRDDMIERLSVDLTKTRSELARLANEKRLLVEENGRLRKELQDWERSDHEFANEAGGGK